MGFVTDLSDAMSVEEKLKRLDMAGHDLFDSMDDDAEQYTAVPEDDAALLHQYASDSEPKIRAAAIDILTKFGPVTWEDAEKWTMDVDADVRRAAFRPMDFSWNALAQLCQSNKSRCAELFTACAERFYDIPVEAIFMCDEDEEWLDLMWSHIGPLLDIGDKQLNTIIICGVLEHILDNKLIGVNDPRVQSWITGGSVERKMALLSVVQWLHMREAWQRQITEALKDDPAQVVSKTARCFLAGKPVADIQSREWA